MTKKTLSNWEFCSSHTVIGCDEVGAGPIAGPLYACAVSLKDEAHLPLVRDSKALTAKQRKDALHPILDAARGWSCRSTLVLGPTILQSRLRLMAACVTDVVSMIGEEDVIVVVDGDMTIPVSKKLRQTVLIKGDQRCLEVACASIVAKVLRDEYMHSLGVKHPEYDFASNAGYATQKHIEAVLRHGVTEHHRPGPTKTALTNYTAKKTLSKEQDFNGRRPTS